MTFEKRNASVGVFVIYNVSVYFHRSDLFTRSDKGGPSRMYLKQPN